MFGIIPKKSMLSVLLVVLLAGTFFAYRFFSNSDNDVLETRTFSCPGMEGFTFEYPVFKGWEPTLDFQKKNNGACILYLSDPTLGAGKVSPEAAPQIYLSFAPYAGIKPAPSFAQVNPHGVKYRTDNGLLNDTGAEFWIGHGLDSAVSITLSNLPENHGFSRDTFWKTVVESFRIVPHSGPQVPARASNAVILN